VSAEVLRYASIPVIAALIGYGTNWVAVRMTFYPLSFRGIPPVFGWQGIIPAKARKMALIAVDSTVSKLGSLREIFDEMDPERIGEHLLTTFEPRVGPLVDELMHSRYPELWEALPQTVRDAVCERVRRRLPDALDSLMEDMAANVDQLLDLRLMVVELLAADKELLNRIFQEAGEAEFAFIVRSGLYFGFVLGLIQMTIQVVVPGGWVLPLAGILVGYTTNWLALNIIFRPVQPRKVGPFTVHGLFLRRQNEVAEVFCRLVTREILTIRNFVDEMLTGPRSDRTKALIAHHVAPLVDEAAGIAAPAVRVAIGSSGYTQLKERLSTRAAELSAVAFDDPVFVQERAVVVERTMRSRMEALSPAEFQQLLRPAFKEDEWKLIAVGAALGGFAGLMQAIFVFA
jgi:uncharacterized membrane protein YheB (UPF0754 family)